MGIPNIHPSAFVTMKIPHIICFLISLPALCLAAEDDGDWEFLKSRLAKVAHVVPLRYLDMTNTFRFVPASLKFIEGADKITVFEGLPHQTFESEFLESELEKIE
jgi:hypothetical protein